MSHLKSGWFKVASLVVALGALFFSICFYCGYWNFYRFQREKQEIRSLERDFNRLENRLQKAVNFYPHPLFLTELGRLRILRAMAEIEYGEREASEPYLDGAAASLKKGVWLNPVDHTLFWEMSKVYFLYNYPLLTYAPKGRLLCREAVRRHPFNEFLVVNVLVVFLEQWSLLEPEEKTWVQETLNGLLSVNPGFLGRLKARWRQSYRETSSLIEKLAELGMKAE